MMEPRICAHCGAEFTPTRATQKFCSLRCQKKTYKAKRRYVYNDSKSRDNREFTAAWNCGHLSPNAAIMKARRKPRGVSDIRWRIELRRRANPMRYDCVGGAWEAR